MRRRGFTFIEVMVALGLLALLTGFAIVSFRTAQGKQSSKAVAETVADMLRLANLRARAQGVPVSVALPSDDGVTPVARGYYHMEGENVPKVQRGYDLGIEFPHGYIFSGTYPGPVWGPPPATLSRGTGFNYDEWLPPFPPDASFIFLPTGEVVSNRSAANGTYRIVVGSRMEYGGPGAPAGPDLPPEFSLTKVCDPYTIKISTLGQIEVVSGLLDGGPGVVVPSGTMNLPLRVAIPPTAYAGPNRPPYMVAPKVVLDPTIDRTLVNVVAPVGSSPSTIIPPGGQVSLTIFARDPDGDQLVQSWSTSPPGLGNFTTTSSRMRWNYQIQAWYRTTTWTPPSTASVNDTFLLKCHIVDGRGGTLDPSAQTGIGYPGANSIGFDLLMMPSTQIVSMHGDGTARFSGVDGANPQPLCSVASPLCWTWSGPTGGLVFNSGTTPQWVGSLATGATSQVAETFTPGGAAIQFSTDNSSAFNSTGLCVSENGMLGMIQKGGLMQVQRMPAPPATLSATPTVVNVGIAHPGDFSGLTAPQAVHNVTLSSDGAGNFLAAWPDAPASSNVFAGPQLAHVQFNSSGSLLYGELPGGGIGVCDVSYSGRVITLSSATAVAAGATCTMPALSPDDNFLICREPAGTVRLISTATGISATLGNITNVTGLLWGKK